MASSSRKPNGQVLRSVSPSGRFSSMSSIHRSSSPTRVNLYSTGGSSPSSALRFAVDRSPSPSRSISVQPVRRASPSGPKKTCMCSPTTHPGSFRCSFHKKFGSQRQQSAPVQYQSNRLYARRSAMTNSLVRIGTVEGDLVKRALAALIRPSSHHQRRRGDFHPRPSRLSVMANADG